MTSRLIVNQIRHTGASADAITMDSSGNVTFPANATCSGTASGFGGGKLLQVVTATQESAVSYSSASYVDLSGMTATVSGVASGSKIMVDIQLLVGRNTASGFGFKLFRDSTFLPFASGEAETFAQYIAESGDNYQYGFHQISFKFIDTHGQSAGSNLVYKLQGTTYSSSNTFYLNRRHYDSGLRGQSRITLTEIAA